LDKKLTFRKVPYRIDQYKFELCNLVSELQRREFGLTIREMMALKTL